MRTAAAATSRALARAWGTRSAVLERCAGLDAIERFLQLAALAREERRLGRDGMPLEVSEGCPEHFGSLLLPLVHGTHSREVAPHCVKEY